MLSKQLPGHPPRLAGPRGSSWSTARTSPDGSGASEPPWGSRAGTLLLGPSEDWPCYFGPSQAGAPPPGPAPHPDAHRLWLGRPCVVLLFLPAIRAHSVGPFLVPRRQSPSTPRSLCL